VIGAYVPAQFELGPTVAFQLQPTFRQLRSRHKGPTLIAAPESGDRSVDGDDMTESALKGIYWIGSSAISGSGLRVRPESRKITLTYDVYSRFHEIIGTGEKHQPDIRWVVQIEDPEAHLYVVKSGST
jgi:hypothetical protein